jgi:hypothetical protein
MIKHQWEKDSDFASRRASLSEIGGIFNKKKTEKLPQFVVWVAKFKRETNDVDAESEETVEVFHRLLIWIIIYFLYFCSYVCNPCFTMLFYFLCNVCVWYDDGAFFCRNILL